MSAADLLACLSEIGASVNRDGDRLVLQSGAVPVAPEIIAAVRQHKSVLLKLLAPTGGVAEPRTAIAPIARRVVELRQDGCERSVTVAGGERPPAWAQDLLWVDPRQPPGDVPLDRWVQFLDDSRRFVDEGWARRAAALGWKPHDLIGCDEIKPYARVDRLGLIWLLNGRAVIAITGDTARICGATGSLCYRRTPTDLGRVLPWNLPIDGTDDWRPETVI
jgi:hypothetical protein